MRRVQKIAAGIWKTFLGGVLCQFALTSVLAVGWTYRAMQRRGLRRWGSRSGLVPEALEALWMDDPAFRAHRTWPNWILGQRTVAVSTGEAKDRRGPRQALQKTVRRAGGSLWANLRIGVAAMLNTWVLTALPVTLWIVGWYSGWDNSFNKGYEQYYVGIALSWTGILVFLIVMLYLPMAQARQAVTGDWRAFYHLRTVWRLTLRNPVRSFLVACAYSLVSFPIFVLLSLPAFFEQVFPGTSSMSDSEFLRFLNRYYFWTALLGFAGFVLLRMITTRIYCDGVLDAVRSGAFTKDDLCGHERAALVALGLDRPEAPRTLRPVVAYAGKAVRPGWRGALILGTLLIWFTFVAQIYVREFVVYHPVRGFANQPLVQLPWFRYVPAELQRAVRAAGEGVRGR